MEIKIQEYFYVLLVYSKLQHCNFILKLFPIFVSVFWVFMNFSLEFQSQ